MIKTSLDWQPIESELLTKLHKIGKIENQTQCRKIILNINQCIRELSRAEVDERRGKSAKVRELLIKVNEDIATVEEFLLIAVILG